MAATLAFRHSDGSTETARRNDPVNFAKRMFVAGSRMLWFEVEGRYYPVHSEESQMRAINRLQKAHGQGVLIHV